MKRPIRPPEGPSLGDGAARGLAWMVMQSAGSKAVSLMGQVALAWILLREDFGAFSLAMTVVGFAAIVETAGLREVLIHRHRRFGLWATPALWASLALGIAVMALIMLAAPVAARIYESDRIVSLMFVLALAVPFNTLSIVPRAKLQIEMRFRALATIGWTRDTAEIVLTVLLALAGFGAMSFALPRPIVALVNCLALWSVARPRVRSVPMIRRWRHLVGDSSLSIATAALAMLMMQGDYMLLGVLLSVEMVGVYYFAFRLSSQTIAIFNANLAQVLLPTLTKIHDEPERQARAFLRGLKILAAVSIPACVLQATVADPAVRLVFAERWYAAIPVIQLLSIGMAFHATTGNPGSILLRAQGRFGLLFVITAIRTVAFFVLVGIGCAYAGIVGAAGGVAIFYAALGLLPLKAAIIGRGGHWLSAIECLWRPIVAASLAAVAATLVDWRLLPPGVTETVRLLTMIPSFICVYGATVLVIMPNEIREIWQRTAAIIGRRTRVPKGNHRATEDSVG